MADGEDGDWAGFINLAKEQVAPQSPFESNILSPILDAANNKTWYGSDIENDRMQSYAPGQRYDESTDEFSKWLGSWTGWSPAKTNYIIDAYSGAIGDFLLPAMTPQAESTPFEKAFVLDTVRSNNVSTRYYDLLDDIQYRKNENDKQAVIEYTIVNRFSSDISDINALIREVQNSDTPDDEKDSRVRQLKATANSLQLQALDAVKNMSDTYGDASYDDRVDGLEKSLYNNAVSQYTSEGLSEEEAKAKAGETDFRQEALDFYADQNPLNNVDKDIAGILNSLYAETGDDTYLLDDDTFTLNGNKYEYPEDMQTAVVEGYTPENGENAGKAIDGLDDLINSSWFQNEDADAQEKLIDDKISSILGAIQYDTVYTEDPLTLAETTEEPDTATYYGFNDYWKAYDPDDEVITSLDSWGVYPHSNASFSQNGIAYTFTDDQQQELADTTYTALRKYYSRLDASSADKIIERVYAAFKDYVASGGNVDTDEILKSVYEYMDEKYEWS
jgi:hypothetical protein